MIHFEIFKSHSAVNSEHWNYVLKDKNLYLSLKYLSALEDTLKDKIKFHYIIYYTKENEAVGVAVTQTLNFVDKGYTENEQVCRIRNKIKKRFVTGNGTRIITCGNPFASGENGFYFDKKIPSKASFKSLFKSIDTISKMDKTSVMLMKEFWKSKFKNSDLLKKRNYSEFEIDVNMVMQIPESWQNREAYYNSLNTKFRSKAKNAYHKSHDLLVQDFQSHEIEKYKNEIQMLYLSVVGKSPFEYGNLKAETFQLLKENLHEEFLFKGYFFKDKLVGFSSAFVFESVLDANFVGIDYSLNQELAIYQRMLYDFVDYAIMNHCNEIRFGRTAEEIKSSIGALPVSMTLFIKHKNLITNLVLKSIISKTKPSPFSLRKPYKSGVLA